MLAFTLVCFLMLVSCIFEWVQWKTAASLIYVLLQDIAEIIWKFFADVTRD